MAKQISVIIPVYQVELYIRAAIESVLHQTHQDIELLVVDDGSPDRSVELCQQLQHPAIQIIRQTNQGVAAARNAGIRQAHGDYIALLDGDDLWLPEKLAAHVSHLDRAPEVGVSFSRSAFINENSEPLGIYQMAKLDRITPLDLLCRTPIGNGSAAVFRKEVFKDIEFYDAESVAQYFDPDRALAPSEDVECWLRVALTTRWKIEGLPNALTLYRVNAQGNSAQIDRKWRSWETLLQKMRAYTPPEVMAQLEAPARAYQLRHLARRAVTLRAGTKAVQLCHQALFTYWRILLEEPRRTLITLAAAYFVLLLPRSLYQWLESFALKLTGMSQKRRILNEQPRQIA